MNIYYLAIGFTLLGVTLTLVVAWLLNLRARVRRLERWLEQSEQEYQSAYAGGKNLARR